MTTLDHVPSWQSRCGLDWLNFFLADVQSGVCPFLAAVTTAAFALLWRLMPETSGHSDS